MKINSLSDRRKFLGRLMTGALATAVLPVSVNAKSDQIAEKPLLKFCLNAYSFNRQLLDGLMTLDELMEFAAEVGLMGVDLTGYYFKGYPDVPSDEIIYRTRRKALSLGLEICGTGVRNDFTYADISRRKESVRLVKAWIDVAHKLGGQTIRIFSGTQSPPGYTRREIFNWMVDDIRECVDYAAGRGIVVALQNHHDFLKTAEETIEVMEAIKSPWFGLMLDIGSFRSGDPYDEIARTIRYAVTWQIKEKVFVNGKETDVDATRLIQLIKDAGFRGYLPLESLGSGDPKEKVRALYRKVSGGS